MKKRIVTFKKYAHGNLQFLEAHPLFGESPSIYELMRWQLESEMKEAFGAVPFKILKTRERYPYIPKKHSFEFVCELGVEDSLPDHELVKLIQEDGFETQKMSGLFELGDYDFHKYQTRREKFFQVKAVVIDTVRIKRTVWMSQYGENLDKFIAGDPSLGEITKKHLVDAANKFVPYSITHAPEASVEIEHLPREFEVDWPQDELKEPLASEEDPGQSFLGFSNPPSPLEKKK